MLVMAINNSVSSTWGYVVVSVLAFLGLGFIAVKYVGKRKNSKMESEEPQNTVGVQQTGQGVNTEVPGVTVDPSTAVDPIVEALGEKVEQFSGNFNALQNIATDDDFNMEYADTVFINVSQVVIVKYGDEVKKWFSAFAGDRKSWDEALYKSKAAALMDLFRACGITPDTTTDYKWTAMLINRYNRMEMIADGEPCEVVVPCWMLDGRVVETGMVRAVRQQ